MQMSAHRITLIAARRRPRHDSKREAAALAFGCSRARTVDLNLSSLPAIESPQLGSAKRHASDTSALGQQLDANSAVLDHASRHDEAIALLDRIETLSAAIVATQAKSLQGLYVKARATAWAMEGDDFDPTKESSINNRVAASIVRDLLQFAAKGGSDVPRLPFRQN